MATELDERAELIKAIDRLNYQDRQKLCIFLAGIEAGKQMQIEESNRRPSGAQAGENDVAERQ